MNRAPANKENVIPIPARYPCQKDIGVRPGKRKAETNLGVCSASANFPSQHVWSWFHVIKLVTDTMDEGKCSPQAPEPWHQASLRQHCSAADRTSQWCTVSTLQLHLPACAWVLATVLICMFLWQGRNLLCRHWGHHTTGTAFHLQQKVLFTSRADSVTQC